MSFDRFIFSDRRTKKWKKQNRPHDITFPIFFIFKSCMQSVRRRTIRIYVQIERDNENSEWGSHLVKPSSGSTTLYTFSI